MKLYRPYPMGDSPEGLCTKRGVSTLFSIDLFRGKCSADPKKVTEYLLTKESEDNRTSRDSYSIMFQDFKLPIFNPDSRLLSSVMVDINNKLSKAMDCRIKFLNGWTIIHHHQYQTAPHKHLGPDHDLACVYWAQVPDQSADLTCYPLGLDNKSCKVKAVEGEFLVFPSDLLHSVTANMSHEPRVSMSFNINLLPKI